MGRRRLRAFEAVVAGRHCCSTGRLDSRDANVGLLFSSEWNAAQNDDSRSLVTERTRYCFFLYLHYLLLLLFHRRQLLLLCYFFVLITRCCFYIINSPVVFIILVSPRFYILFLNSLLLIIYYFHIYNVL